MVLSVLHLVLEMSCGIVDRTRHVLGCVCDRLPLSLHRTRWVCSVEIRASVSRIVPGGARLNSGPRPCRRRAAGGWPGRHRWHRAGRPCETGRPCSICFVRIPAWAGHRNRRGACRRCGHRRRRRRAAGGGPGQHHGRIRVLERLQITPHAAQMGQPVLERHGAGGGLGHEPKVLAASHEQIEFDAEHDVQEGIELSHSLVAGRCACEPVGRPAPPRAARSGGRVGREGHGVLRSRRGRAGARPQRRSIVSAARRSLRKVSRS